MNTNQSVGIHTTVFLGLSSHVGTSFVPPYLVQKYFGSLTSITT